MSNRRRTLSVSKIASITQPVPAQCFGYCRVSTAMQADTGQSLDVQERAISGYAMMHGFTVTKTFTERGISGSKPLATRPEGKALLAALRPGDCVIITALDRAFRSALDALATLQDMRKRHIALHVTGLGGNVSNGNTTAELLFGVLAHVAEFERALTCERVRGIKADQRNRSRYLGGKVPFGFSVGIEGQLVPMPEQQAAIRRMKQLKGKGESLRAIAAAMVKAGFTISYIGVRDVLGRAT